jgi:hypothetical protein
MPALRRRPGDAPESKDDVKAAMLAEKFFPPSGNADLTDVVGEP